MKTKTIFIFCFILAVLSLILASQPTRAAENPPARAETLYYQNSPYTNLCGSNTDASFYNCTGFCDPDRGFCSTSTWCGLNGELCPVPNAQAGVPKYWVAKYTCNAGNPDSGVWYACGDNEQIIGPNDSTTNLNLRGTECGKIVQLDVFDKTSCKDGNCGGVFPLPPVVGYMVWYSGKCTNSPTPTPTPSSCVPTANPHNPSPRDGQTDVSLQPALSWSWDCNPTDWVSWVDVYLWNCNPAGANCPFLKPIGYTQLRGPATSVTLSQLKVTSLNPATNYWWKVVPNSNKNATNVWQFTTLTCSANNTTDAYVSTIGGNDTGITGSTTPITGTQTVYVKGKNQANISPVNISINPGGNSSSDSDKYLSVGNPDSLTAGAPPNGITHAVTSYNGPTPNYCGKQTAYTCTTVAPAIVPGSPNTIDPKKVAWTLEPVQLFGIDHCGGDNTIDDQIKVDLYSGSDPKTGTLLGSCTTISGGNVLTTKNCTIIYTGTFTDGQQYSYLITANNNTSKPCLTSNKENCTIKDFSFTYGTTAAAWFQTVNGGVFAGGSKNYNLQSQIPVSCTPLVNCWFNINKENPNYPGIVSYDNSGSAPNINKLSQKNWLARSAFYTRLPTYDDFKKQIPVSPDNISDQNNLNGKINSGGVTGGSDALYLIYNNDPATDSTDFSIGPLNIGTNKVVLYVPPSTSGHKVYITDNITTTQGSGFFGLITGRPVSILKKTTEVDGLIFTDATGTALTTEQNGVPANPGLKQLTINGTVVLTNGSATLNRTLSESGPTPNNTDSPAEKFSFDPSLIFTMPRGLRRLQYQVNEVPATQ